MTVRALGSGEGERRYGARGSVMFFKALAEQNGGDFSLMERTLPPGGRGAHGWARGLRVDTARY